MIFYLIRHGKSVANEAGLVTGTPVDTLAPEGVAQTERLARWLEKAGFRAQRHVTSQWGRACQTASGLRPDTHWQIDPRVGETDAGDVADWTLVRFVAVAPEFYAAPNNCYPGGESHLELNARVLSWFHDQLQSPCDALMLVSHSGPISCILQHVLGMPMERFPAFLPAHASLSVIDMVEKHGDWHGKLLGFSLCPVGSLPQHMYGSGTLSPV